MNGKHRREAKGASMATWVVRLARGALANEQQPGTTLMATAWIYANFK